MKKALLYTVLFFCCAQLFATTVTVDQARTVALNFFKIKAGQSLGRTQPAATLVYTRVETDNTVDFYVFNMSPVNGFVIVSADNIVNPVIAYSTEATFVTNFKQIGLSNWVASAGGKIHNAILQQVAPARRTTALWAAFANGQNVAGTKSTAVLPLVKTIWNQEPYYNAFCPYDSVDMQRAVTGCVATSMAQVMKYWNYPAQGMGSYSYTCVNHTRGDRYNYGVQSADFGSTTYSWTQMVNNVTRLDSAVALLMYHCGVSVGMGYGDDNQDGSSAIVLADDAFGGQNSQSAFVTYFGYDPNSINGVYRSSYADADWINLLDGELNAGRPLIYTGQDTAAGGHAWVCDGYDDNNLFHMNWGWGGGSNGYYDVSALSPSGTGLNFNNFEEALIGIQPIMPVLSLSTKSINLCSGDTAVVTATTASSVTYSWSPAAGLSCTDCASPSISPTASTMYTLVIDSAGYNASATVTVNVRAGVVAANDTFANASCYGSSNGFATIKALMGTQPYSYKWSNGATTASISSIPSEFYYVTVTDAGGCSAAALQIITEPAPIVVSTQGTEASSCTSANGAVVLAASGGSGSGYSFDWANGSTANALSGVTPGNYAVTVSDGSGCTTATDVVVPGPYQIVVDVATANATNGDNGEATIENVADGTGPYSYLWSTGSTASSISSLAPSTYTLTVTDKNGCNDVVSVTVSASTATGITPVNNSFSLNVYPNPATSYVNVQVGNTDNETTLYLENILGQTLVIKPLTSLQTQLDVSQLPGGIYMLELRQGSKKLVRQIIVGR